MLNFMTSTILAFTVISSSADTLLVNDFNSFDISHISYEAKEVEWHYSGIIGRHRYMQVHSYSSLGILPIDTLSNYYDANVLTDFHFSEKFTTVTQTTLSTKKQMGVQLTTGLEATIGLPGAEIKNSQELTTQFTIDQTVTYMVSRTQKFQVDMLVNQAKVQGKVFALALAAEVYTIKWSTWQVDDYWWGKYEVKGSRQEEVAYLSIKPYVTIVERDKGLIF